MVFVGALALYRSLSLPSSLSAPPPPAPLAIPPLDALNPVSIGALRRTFGPPPPLLLGEERSTENSKTVPCNSPMSACISTDLYVRGMGERVVR